MTLSELLASLVTPDHFPGGALLPLDVVFATGEFGGEQTLLSCYYADGKIHVDIGMDGE